MLDQSYTAPQAPVVALASLVDCLSDVRERQERRESSLIGQIEDPLRLVVSLAYGAPAGRFLAQLCFGSREPMIGVAEEDEPEHGNGVFR